MTNWVDKRDEQWDAFNMFAEKNAPEVKEHYVTYFIGLPLEAKAQFDSVSWSPIHIWVNVYGDGLLEVDDNTTWYGTSYEELNHDERKEVMGYLTEWDFAEWRRIGPEDSELFATEKLCQMTRSQTQ